MYTASLDIPAQNGRVAVFQGGDLHADLKSFDRSRFQKWQNLILDYVNRGNTAIVILQGDSVHGRLPGDKFFDASILRSDVLENAENYVGYMTRDVGGLYKPFTDAGIPTFLLKGNHDAKLKHVDIAEEIAREAGIEYANTEMLLRVRARDQYGKAKTKTIYAAHGSGGGATPGGKLNKAAKSVHIAEADGYFYGHLHDSVYHIEAVPYLKRDGEPALNIKERLYSYSSSFVKGREQGVHDYPSAKSLPSVNQAINAFTLDTWNDLWLPTRIL